MSIFRSKKISFFTEHGVLYPTPINLSYLWSFGSLALICLFIQIISGVLLAMHYSPQVDLAFNSVEHIMRDVNYGWLIRYTHSNGASMFFLVIYIHMARGLYYGSFLYPRRALWISGCFIFVLMIITAFMGYVLPWGQMSFWAATVITNLFTVIPFIGETIAQWFWGGFSVDNATLNRFFSLHYILPFIIVGLILIHLFLLHYSGSNNTLGNNANDYQTFYPYYYIKDIFSIFCLSLLFVFFVFFKPNLLGHPDNYIEANSMITPTHIVPEWYFLPFYAILRSIPSKIFGVILMALSIVLLFILPYIGNTEIRSTKYRPFYKYLYWFFIFDILLLGWLGQQVVEYPYTILSQIATSVYFMFFFFLFFFCKLETFYLTENFVYFSVTPYFLFFFGWALGQPLDKCFNILMKKNSKFVNNDKINIIKKKIIYKYEYTFFVGWVTGQPIEKLSKPLLLRWFLGENVDINNKYRLIKWVLGETIILTETETFMLDWFMGKQLDFSSEQKPFLFKFILGEAINLPLEYTWSRWFLGESINVSTPSKSLLLKWVLGKPFYYPNLGKLDFNKDKVIIETENHDPKNSFFESKIFAFINLPIFYVIKLWILGFSFDIISTKYKEKKKEREKLYNNIKICEWCTKRRIEREKRKERKD